MTARFNTRAYVASSAIGFGFLLLIALLEIGLSFWAVSQGQQASVDPAVIQSMAILSSGMSVLACVCGSLLSVACGAVYGLWIARTQQAGPDEGAIGGAASAATAQTLGGLIQAALSLTILPLALQRAGAQIGQPYSPAIVGVSLISSGVGSLISVCASALFGGVLGALGGVVGGAIGRRSN